jgi:hypothetical protein
MDALHTIEMSVSKQITSREGYANANRPCLFVISSGMGADGSSTARNVLTHPLARRDVPLALARAFQFAKPQFKGVAEAALYCAHRTSTF